MFLHLLNCLLLWRLLLVPEGARRAADRGGVRGASAARGVGGLDHRAQGRAVGAVLPGGGAGGGLSAVGDRRAGGVGLRGVRRACHQGGGDRTPEATWAAPYFYRNEITLFSHIVAHNPEARIAHLNLGNALLKADRTEEGLAASRIAVAQRPEFAAARSILGQALIDSKRFAEAEERLRRALELDPDSAATHQNLAETLRKQRRSTEAIESYRAALEIDPELALAHARYGYGPVRGAALPRGPGGAGAGRGPATGVGRGGHAAPVQWVAPRARWADSRSPRSTSSAPPSSIPTTWSRFSTWPAYGAGSSVTRRWRRCWPAPASCAQATPWRCTPSPRRSGGSIPNAPGAHRRMNPWTTPRLCRPPRRLSR